MHQHGISTIWSHDRDLRKFGGITVRDPFVLSRCLRWCAVKDVCSPAFTAH